MSRTIKYSGLILGLFLFMGQGNFYAIAQTETSEPVILSGDLSNDPVAQDILKKIELTKQWIAELEQKEYEKLQAKKFLEEKRQEALTQLEKDLDEWEKVWEYYSSRNAFERFVNKKPEEVRGVFWNAFEFKEIKVNAGKTALKDVLQNGGNLREAREAYHKAAETKRIELIEQNNKFNVENNLAFYKQQILFDSSGKFIRTPEAKERLREMYPDYRQSEAYLAANPQDKFAYSYTPQSNTQENIAAQLEQEREKEIESTINQINEEFMRLSSEYNTDQIVLKDHFDTLYQNLEIEAKQNEKDALQDFNSNKTMSKKEISNQIIYIRNWLIESKEKILEEKNNALLEIQAQYDNKTNSLIKKYDNSLDIKISWNWESQVYQATRK